MPERIIGIMSSEVLGTTKLTEGKTISLVKEVRKELDGVDDGDILVYRKRDGEIFLEVLE